jgi:hypothetical protein
MVLPRTQQGPMIRCLRYKINIEKAHAAGVDLLD